MEFVAVLGARVGEEFLPVKSVVWRLEDDHARDSSGALNSTEIEATADAATNGAPADPQSRSDGGTHLPLHGATHG